MANKEDEAERLACVPVQPKIEHCNTEAEIPFDVKPKHILGAMSDFVAFLGTVNAALYEKKIPRLEAILMPANFSSMVGEFVGVTIPKYARGVARNTYHNGHPDLVAAGAHLNDSVQHCDKGIEIKASRYAKNWQGHNVEGCWLMVFVFSSNRPVDVARGRTSRPFRFLGVFGAQLDPSDWSFAGRGSTSRRTPTASVRPSGFEKMTANWIYRVPNYAASLDTEDDD